MSFQIIKVVWIIPSAGKSCVSFPVQKESQWITIRNENIQPHIKFVTIDQVWIFDVVLNGKERILNLFVLIHLALRNVNQGFDLLKVIGDEYSMSTVSISVSRPIFVLLELLS